MVKTVTVSVFIFPFLKYIFGHYLFFVCCNHDIHFFEKNKFPFYCKYCSLKHANMYNPDVSGIVDLPLFVGAQILCKPLTGFIRLSYV